MKSGGTEGEGEGKDGRNRVGVREREGEWTAGESRRSFSFSGAIHLICPYPFHSCW